MPEIPNRLTKSILSQNGIPCTSKNGSGLHESPNTAPERNSNRRVVTPVTDHLPDMAEFETGSMLDVMKLVGDVTWLVPQWVPNGMLTEIMGEPGKGKSLLLLWMMRSVILGEDWFNGTKGLGEPRNVLLCDTEGRAAINLDRLKKWGVPIKAMARIKTPFEGKDVLKPVDLTSVEHQERIEMAIHKYKIPLVGVDSLRGSHGGDENSSKMSEVLKPLVQMMERTAVGCCVVHHTKKIQGEEDICPNSSRGSNAILADFVSQIAVDVPDPNSEWKRVQVLKENLGSKPLPMGFRKMGDGEGLEFGAAPIRPAKMKKETGKDKCEEWLRARMTPGIWYDGMKLIEEAQALGFSPTGTLQRAKEALGISKPASTVKKFGKGWQWQLPMNISSNPPGDM